MASHEKSQSVRHGRISAGVVSVSCFLRGLPLFFSAAPKTPLRVLCMMAFNTLHILRTSKPLPRQRLSILATWLDFAACANAVLDQKKCCPDEYLATQNLLENFGMGTLVEGYL